MADYIVVWDSGVPSGEVYHDLTEARKARKALVDAEGQHLGDFCHVVSVTIVPEPGAWKVVMDGEEHYYCANQQETVDRLDYYGRLDTSPVWIPTYEWTKEN